MFDDKYNYEDDEFEDEDEFDSPYIKNKRKVSEQERVFQILDKFYIDLSDAISEHSYKLKDILYSALDNELFTNFIFEKKTFLSLIDYCVVCENFDAYLFLKDFYTYDMKIMAFSNYASDTKNNKLKDYDHLIKQQENHISKIVFESALKNKKYDFAFEILNTNKKDNLLLSDLYELFDDWYERLYFHERDDFDFSNFIIKLIEYTDFLNKNYIENDYGLVNINGVDKRCYDCSSIVIIYNNLSNPFYKNMLLDKIHKNCSKEYLLNIILDIKYDYYYLENTLPELLKKYDLTLNQSQKDSVILKYVVENNTITNLKEMCIKQGVNHEEILRKPFVSKLNMYNRLTVTSSLLDHASHFLSFIFNYYVKNDFEYLVNNFERIYLKDEKSVNFVLSNLSDDNLNVIFSKLNNDSVNRLIKNLFHENNISNDLDVTIKNLDSLFNFLENKYYGEEKNLFLNTIMQNINSLCNNDKNFFTTILSKSKSLYNSLNNEKILSDMVLIYLKKYLLKNESEQTILENIKTQFNEKNGDFKNFNDFLLRQYEYHSGFYKNPILDSEIERLKLINHISNNKIKSVKKL